MGQELPFNSFLIICGRWRLRPPRLYLAEVEKVLAVFNTLLALAGHPEPSPSHPFLPPD